MNPTPPASEWLARPPIQSLSVTNRRAFLQRVLGAAAVANAVALPAGLNASPEKLPSAQSLALHRRNRAFHFRSTAALAQKHLPLATHLNNGDEDRYPTRIGNFSKGLPHNELGEVDPGAYDQFLAALRSEKPEDFEAIPLGCANPAQQRKLTNPQAGLAFDLEGVDSHALAIPPAPAFASDEAVGEIVENYWMALCRDVPFADYATSGATQAAAADMDARRDFRGPKSGGHVTTSTLFRGLTPGDLNGPYLSQFLLLPVPFGANYVEQRMRCIVAGSDFLTSYREWLDCQRGCKPTHPITYDTTRRLIRNGRDLSQWVHIDVLYQAYFHAMLILLTPPDDGDANASGLGVPFDSGNPYAHSATQDSFATFGGPHIAALMAEVATRALKAVWYQKWFVHCRLRPEAFAGRIHNHVTGPKTYPISSDLESSSVLAALHDAHGTYLLPMAFPEGSPLHPAYGAGHATVAGACVTILKAWFDETHVIPNPVLPSADGLTLIPYVGPPLTVGGELNKLASNVAIGRNHAGVHWRSDATESLKLGEAVALSVLRDQKACYNESFNGFTVTGFDGSTIIV